MAAKALVPVGAFPCVHLAPCMALGFGRHKTVRRHCLVSTLIHCFRGHGPLLQGAVGASHASARVTTSVTSFDSPSVSRMRSSAARA